MDLDFDAEYSILDARGAEAESGNAVIMEAFPMRPADNPAADGAGKRATYFFRLAGRKDYALSKSVPELDKMMEDFGRFFNSAMGAVNVEE